MIATFEQPETSKHLYFNLNNALHLANPPFSATYKIAGVYAIFKNDKCYYVGQSKNLPSRIATHLTGKYESVDRVDLHFIGEDNFCGFYSRTKSEQKEILENNEKWLINRLKPIENLLVSDEIIASEYVCDEFQSVDEGESDYYCSASITVECQYITVSDVDPVEAVLSLPEKCRTEYLRYQDHMNQYLKGAAE